MTGFETAHKTGVVIRSLNEERHIGRLLTGLSHQTRKPSRVVLVDSGSTDATVEIAQRFDVDVVTIGQNEFSFGRSLNRGIAECDTDVVVVASAHVYPVFDSWLELLTQPIRRDDATALAYGRQVGDERTKYSERRLMLRWFPETSEVRQSNPFANNANAAVRRSVWLDQPYDEELTGLEDLDWARRALDAGHNLSYVAEAPVVHVHEENWDRLRNRYRREAIAHRRIFREQQMTRVEALMLGLRNTITDYTAAARDGALAGNLLSIPSFHAAQFIGAYQGFAQEGSVPVQLKRRFYFPTAAERPPALEPGIGLPIDYSSTDGSEHVD